MKHGKNYSEVGKMLFKKYYLDRVDLQDNSVKERITKKCSKFLESCCVGSFNHSSEVISLLDNVVNSGVWNCPFQTSRNKLTEFTWVTSKFGNLESGTSYLDKLCIYVDTPASLDFKHFPNLKFLILINRPLTFVSSENLRHINLPELKGLNASNIEEIYIEGFSIDILDLEKFTSLRSISCPDNKIKKLVLPRSKNLFYLDCSDNLIDELLLSYYPHLCNLFAFGNPFNAMEEIDLTASKYIATAILPSTLDSFDLAENKSLKWIASYTDLVIISTDKAVVISDIAPAMNYALTNFRLNKHEWLSLDDLNT